MIQYAYGICNLMVEVFSLIRACGLTKWYGNKPALNGVHFSIEEGCVAGLLGLNGAGKSTIMNILAGCISATGGTAAIGGYDIATRPTQAKRITGYLPEQPAFYPEMRVVDHLAFICGLKGISAGRMAHIDKVCRLTGLEEVRGRMIRNLSKGYRQRLGFAQAMVGDPTVIILDEPTAGLDPAQIIETRQLIKMMGRSGTVIVSSHILSEIQAVCDRVIMLQGGRVAADNRIGEMTGRLASGARVKVRVKGDAGAISAALNTIPGVSSVLPLAQREPGALDFALESVNGADIRVHIFEALAAAGLPLLDARSAEDSLEEAFLRLAAAGSVGEDAL
jgi:ABC-2 type transport system ATP-binding protein